MSSRAAQWLQNQLSPIDDALRELVETNSFTGNAAGGRAVGHALLEYFCIEGLTPEVVPSALYADHLVFRSSGIANVAPISLLGHLDTVFPPGLFEGYRADGPWRRGPGVYDMKGGLLVIA